MSLQSLNFWTALSPIENAPFRACSLFQKHTHPRNTSFHKISLTFQKPVQQAHRIIFMCGLGRKDFANKKVNKEDY